MRQRERDGILVVDDDAEACESLTNALRQSGYAVESARDGFEALERLARNTPDLVLTDLRMPGMSGLELIKKIEESKRGAPVILVTGVETGDLCTGAPGYGAFSCLIKPINLDELLWAIDCALVCNREGRSPDAAAGA
jgi:two-component system nitrogen regulation response regulator GlnG